MKKVFLLLFSFSMLVVSIAQSQVNYTFDKKIAVPGDGGYDYLAIDQVNRHLFVSHGTSFNVIDLDTEKPIATITGMKGVHGIAIVNDINRGFISDGRDNAVVVVDLTNFKIIKKIQLTATDEDGIIYDPYSKKVFVFNGDSKNTSVIDVNQMTEIKVIDLGGGPEFAASDGAGLIYNNIEDLNVIKIIDTKTLTVKGTYPLAPCGGPTGLAYDPVNKRLFTGCRQNKGLSVLDAVSGRVITTLPIGAGVDAVIYDAEMKLIFVSNGDATTNIFKQNTADDYSLVQTLTTQPRAKTMAFDKKTRKIYLSAPDFDKETKKAIPGTFGVLVYKP